MSWNEEGKLICDRCEKEIKSKKLKQEKKNSKYSICLVCFDELEEKRKSFLIKSDGVDFINSSNKNNEQ